MKKHNWLADNWIVLFLIVPPFILCAIAYGMLPEEVPVHWNHNMEVDRYGSRMEAMIGLLLIAGSSVLINGIIWLMPKLDPKGTYQQFAMTIKRIQIITSAFLLGIFLIVFASMLGIILPSGKIIMMSVIMLFLLLGNYFGKLRPNYFMGIRTPWTLESEDNWLKTHRLGGVVWVAGSVLMLILAIFLPELWLLYLMLPYILVLVLVPIAYSYRLYRESSGG